MEGPKVDWECALVCLCSLAVYLNTLGHGFAYDDNRAILTNPDVQASSPFFQVFQNDFWGTPLSSSNSHGSYRPLCVLSFRLNHWTSGYLPFGFHLVNVLLHVLVTALVLTTSRLLLPGRSPVLAAVLFAVHPIHVEAVAGVVGRADVLAAVFFLCSFTFYVKHVKVRDSIAVVNFSNTKDNLGKQLNRTTNRTKRYSDSVSTESVNLVNNSEHRRLILFPRDEKFYFSLFLVSSVCAVLSKETGITVIPLAVCYDIILHLRSKRFYSYKPYITASASASIVSFLAITLARLYIMGLQTPAFSKADNPAAKESSIITRTLTFLYLPIFNFLLLLWPQRLSFDWSMDSISRITSLLDVRIIFSFAFYYILYRTVKSSFTTIRSQKHKNSLKHQLCKVCTKDSLDEHSSSCKIINNNNIPQQCNCNNASYRPLSKGSLVTMCLAFLALPFLPASNLFFYVGFVIAERVLYIPSIGFCMLVAVGVRSMLSYCNKFLVAGGFLFLVAVLAGRTVQRNRDWSTEESLYRSAVHINPPKAYGNLGSVLSSSGRLQEAEAALRLALQHRPNMADVHYNLGNLLSRQQKHQEAVLSYKLAIQYRPSLAVAYLNLGQVLETLDRWPEVEDEYRKCGELDDFGLKDPKAHEDARSSCRHRLTVLCNSRQCRPESLKVLKKVVAQKNDKHDFQPLGIGLIPASNDIGHTTAHRNNTRTSEKEEFCLRALQRTPTDPVVYVNYGQLLVQQRRLTEAASMYLKAAQLAPAQHAVVTSAAIALRQVNRLPESETLYRQARDLRPMDAASHSNLGAIFHLQGKYRQAAASYKEALRLSPNDQVTLANLQKLRNLITRNKR